MDVHDRVRLVVLDFDGTLCLGDDPVLAYARLVDEALESAGANRAYRIRDAVQRGLDAADLRVPEIRCDDRGYPTDIAGTTDMALWPLQDGYQLVQLLALQSGLTSVEINAAFRASRAELLQRGLAASDVHAPAGVTDILSELRQRVAVVLVTNSPADRFDAWLAQLELQDHFDLIINSAGKPGGMPAAVKHAMTTCATADAPMTMDQVVSIGDIWGNDLAYVHEQGGTTVLIDRFNTGLGAPDHRVTDAATAFRLLDDQQVSTR